MGSPHLYLSVVGTTEQVLAAANLDRVHGAAGNCHARARLDLEGADAVDGVHEHRAAARGIDRNMPRISAHPRECHAGEPQLPQRSLGGKLLAGRALVLVVAHTELAD